MPISISPSDIFLLPVSSRRVFDRVVRRIVFWMATLLCAAGALVIGAAPAVAAVDYVDAVHYPAHQQGWDAFRDLELRLVKAFDDACGDTICEGEFTNIQALRYRCSVQQSDGMMGECRWTFAASNAGIDASAGTVMVDARTWACRTPLGAQTPVATFYSALTVARPLHVALPGTTATIFDGLMDCLN